MYVYVSRAQIIQVLNIRKAVWHWFVDECLCMCLCMVNTSGDVCFCWKPYIHSNRQVNPGNRQRCGCSVRTLPFDHFVIHSHWINADNTGVSSAAVQGRVLRGFPTWGGVKSSPECSCALLSSAARTNYVGTWCQCWANERRDRGTRR